MVIYGLALLSACFFGGMLLGCVLIVGALLFMPVAVLGPIAEHLSAVR